MTRLGPPFAQPDLGQPKECIERVGTLFDGTPVYRYYYVGNPACHIGLLAKDVAREAVTATGGIDVVLATSKATEITR